MKCSIMRHGGNLMKISINGNMWLAQYRQKANQLNNVENGNGMANENERNDGNGYKLNINGYRRKA